MKPGLTVFLVFLTLFLALGVVKWFAQTRPYEQMKVQIANLPMGIQLQQAKAQINREPEFSCSSEEACKQELHYYSRYKPNPVLKVRGPVLVYRMAGIDHIHCLYFDAQHRLIFISESTL